LLGAAAAGVAVVMGRGAAGVTAGGKGEDEARRCRSVSRTCSQDAQCCSGSCGPPDVTGLRVCLCVNAAEDCPVRCDLGPACAELVACALGACRYVGCLIEDDILQEGERKEGKPCQYCDPNRNWRNWSDHDDGVVCGDPAGDPCIDDFSTCLAGECVPKPLPDGLECGEGQVCCLGSCCEAGVPCNSVTGCGGCEIGGKNYHSGASTTLGCQVCNAVANPNDWTRLTDDAPCGDNLDRVCCDGFCCGVGECCNQSRFCEACCDPSDGNRKRGTGTCEPGCTIDGVDYDDGEVNPNGGHFSCEVCNAAYPTVWSPRFHGDCPPPCTIDGVVIPYGTLNPQNECEHCDGGVSATAWSPADGASCGEAQGSEAQGRVCCGGTCCGDGECCGEAGLCQIETCAPVCTIDGVEYADGAVNPANPCEECEAVNHPTAWMYKTHGRCGPELKQFCCYGVCCDPGVCCSLGRGSCDPEDPCDGCTIEGVFYYDGEPNPANSCDYCKASRSADSWSYMGDGGMCEDDLYRHCCNGVCCAYGERCNLDILVCEHDPNRAPR
jgi:hypothetical protein